MVNYQPPEFAPSPLATATLTKQLQLLATADTEAMGFAVEPVGDNLYQWAVKMYYTDMETQLARDLQNHPTQKHVDMEFRFPAGYPCEPPFCRVVAPVFARGTGYVQSHGGICMELLTGSGWTPANSMDAVAVQIHSFLTAGKGRLDLITPGRVKDYTFAGALRDMSAIVNAHAWDVGNARVAKPRKRARGEDGDV
jgi:ubiquitin-conjugating enzyme E2 Q